MLQKASSFKSIPTALAFMQLVKEFWLPLILASSWTIFYLVDMRADDRSVKTFVNVFGPAFFLASWAISQWFRVQKQQKVDSGLKSIESAVNRSLAEMESRTIDVLGSITGGDSSCYLFGPTPEADIWSRLLVVHVGKFPLYEVSVRITDLDVFEELLKKDEPVFNGDRSEMYFSLRNLAPNFANFANFSIPMGAGPSRRFNIFFTARNGESTQLLRCRKVEEKWIFATRLVRNEVVLHERVDDNYPVSATGSVDWN